MLTKLILYEFVSTITSLYYSYTEHKHCIKERTLKNILKILSFTIISLFIFFGICKYPIGYEDQKQYLYFVLFLLLFKVTYSLYLIIDNKLNISEKYLMIKNKLFLYYSPLFIAFFLNVILTYILLSIDIFQLYFLDIERQLFTILLIEFILAAINLESEHKKIDLNNMNIKEKIQCYFSFLVDFLKKTEHYIIVISILIGFGITYI